MKTIELVVSPQGDTVVRTKGFVGSTCREASQFLEQALGRRTTEQLSAEFHQTASAEQVRATE